MKQLDMRGQPCPIPVVQAKKALAEDGAIGVEVLVDNIIAIQNLKKMADGNGYTYSYMQKGPNEWSATIVMGDAPPPKGNTLLAPTAPAATGGLTVLIASNQLGTGAEDLGKILIKGFIFSLTELPTPPEAVIFLNGGAQLTAKNANTLQDLQTLAQKGTQIYTCGTCLNYYNLNAQPAVGEVIDMMGIVSRLAAAGRLISV